MAKRVIKVSGHCQDRFTLEYGNVTLGPDYVPYHLGIGGGDSIDLEIDLDTGKILNWVPPTEEKMNQILEQWRDDEGKDEN